MKISLIINRLIILIAGIFIFSIPQSYAQEHDENNDIFPQEFSNIKDAEKHGCKFENFRGQKIDSCFLTNFEDHELKLVIYDATTDGQFVKSQELCIPSWYNFATIKFDDLLGNGQQFIFITFEGNTGTGTLQMIEMIIGWHDGKYIPVLAETISYRLSEDYDVATLNMKYNIRNEGSSEVNLILKYDLKTENIGESNFKSTASWHDTLKWNKESFSFYSDEDENKKDWNRTNNFLSYTVQHKISEVRKTIKDIDINNLCESFFDKTKIMYILYSN